MKPNLIRYGGTVIAIVFVMAILNALALQYVGFGIPPAATILLPLMLAAAREGQIAARAGLAAPEMPALLRAAGICTAVYALIAACFFLVLRLSFGEAFALPGAGMARFGLTGFILVVAFVINASFLSLGHKTETKKLAQKAGK
ncbi:ABZJ_00895 family protein [Pseudoruegeria sp. SHC-113]|uniref:ABZJ_00895 family protein n=1 Tax=Pseudoruegeria sp. SHC-113 TaxID=2855439 RepID=UPI0021BA9E8D|nr:ABZJ_00895 family protein [Pseudoruegeria sp. SHC-113]MCT8158828.1 ABZJ_00895 family protein [Pseudoruegeria sp. SHC-113]